MVESWRAGQSTRTLARIKFTNVSLLSQGSCCEHSSPLLRTAIREHLKRKPQAFLSSSRQGGSGGEIMKSFVHGTGTRPPGPSGKDRGFFNCPNRGSRKSSERQSWQE